jgi:hypothetical protein
MFVSYRRGVNMSVLVIVNCRYMRNAMVRDQTTGRNRAVRKGERKRRCDDAKHIYERQH